MCIEGKIKKVMRNNVPKVGYKLVNRRKGYLETPYQYQQLTPGILETPDRKKVAKKIEQDSHDPNYLNRGRFSVFLNKKEAKKHIDGRRVECWRVEIVSNTAFIGTWSGSAVAVVDNIKLVRRVAKCRLWLRFSHWWHELW